MANLQASVKRLFKNTWNMSVLQQLPVRCSDAARACQSRTATISCAHTAWRPVKSKKLLNSRASRCPAHPKLLSIAQVGLQLTLRLSAPESRSELKATQSKQTMRRTWKRKWKSFSSGSRSKKVSLALYTDVAHMHD